MPSTSLHPSGAVTSLPAAVVLAAGKGTRMRSTRHKVLHQLAGKSMLWHVLSSLRQGGVAPARTVIVVAAEASDIREEVAREFPSAPYVFAVQDEARGTGHAVQQAQAASPVDAPVLVVAYGDTPLLRADTVAQLIESHARSGLPVTLVTGHMLAPQDLGRIVRDARGAVRQIVEARDTTPEQRAINEVNSGFCAFQPAWLWENLPRVAPARNGEIYLTALPALAIAQGMGAGTLVLPDVVETIGVNTREQQADAEQRLRVRIASELFLAGVTIQDPATAYVDAGVSVGQDTVIYANTHVQGDSAIGESCELGPNAIIRDSTIGDRCRVLASVLRGARLEDDVSVGPFAHLRPGTHCGRGVEVGTGSEVKASTLGANTKMHHFGYVGDSTVGTAVNIGAGTVTCNFDGESKHATRIGDGAFIGSDSLLIAPLVVGRGALTGAGSVVTRNVTDGDRVAGVPARSIGVRKTRGERHGNDTRPVA